MANGIFKTRSETEPRQNSVILGLVKYDASGNEVWATSSGGGPIGFPQVKGLLLDKMGSVYTEFNFLANAGNIGAYQTLKCSSNGTLVWYDYNPTQNVTSQSTAFALDSQSNVLVTGKYAWSAFSTSSYGTYKISTNGSYIWTNLYPVDASTASEGLAITTDSIGNVFVTGNSTNLSIGYGDIVTIKYDSNGNQLWLQRYDEPGHRNDAGNAIAVDNSGNVYVAGYETETNGFTSMILIKYAPVPTIQKQTNGNVILHAYGSPGETFDVQASTNLQTWQDMGDVVADTNRIVSYDDTNSSLFPSRFYYTVPQ